VIVPILVALGIPVALHAAWRVRYGYPPPDLPRVLCFHKLSTRFCWEGTWTTPARFASIVDRLRDRGYTFIDETAFLSALDSPGVDGSRSVFLTFDDGYAHLVDTAWPILGERGVPFHVFLVTDYIGRTNAWDLSLGRPAFRHLDREQVREMAALGVTFGSHTSGHHDLTRLTPGAVADDLARSRRVVEDATGARVRTLSYPFGRYNQAVRRAARDAGFDAAFSLYPAHRNATVDRHALRREGVYVIDTPRTVESKLEPNVLYGLEEMKCRAINAVARLTPLLKNRGAHGA
jgi:peptidoglycan/xylan/chitin deacetylase (PgdA/CDA1 family)